MPAPWLNIYTLLFDHHKRDHFPARVGWRAERVLGCLATEPRITIATHFLLMSRLGYRGFISLGKLRLVVNLDVRISPTDQFGRRFRRQQGQGLWCNGEAVRLAQHVVGAERIRTVL